MYFVSSQYPALRVLLRKEDMGTPEDVPVHFDEHIFWTQDPKVIENLQRIIEIEKTCCREQSFDVLRSENPLNTTNKHIVLQRMGGLGDILFTLPIVEYLHSMGHKIDYYCHFAFWQIFQNNPHINKVWVNGLLKARAEGNMDVPEQMTIDQYGTYARPYSFKGSIETNADALKLHATEACYKYIGIDDFQDKPMKPKLYITDNEKKIIYRKLEKYRGIDPSKKTIGVAVESSAVIRSYPHREWLIEELEEDYNVIRLHFGEKWTEQHENSWHLREAMTITSLLDLLVCADSGMMHVAGACGVPILALFGPINPELRLKYYDNCQVICQTLDVCDNFCYNHFDECKLTGLRSASPPCMDIDPAIILKKIKEMV